MSKKPFGHWEYHSLEVIYSSSFSSRHCTSFSGGKFWPSQRHLSISLDPGCRLSSF